MTKSEKTWDGQAWFACFSDVCGVFAPNASEDIKRALSTAPNDLVSAPTDSRAWRTAFALGAELHFWRRAFAGEPVPSKLRDVKGGMWARNADGYLAPLMEPAPEDCEIDTPEKLYAWMRGYEYAAGVTLSEDGETRETRGADDFDPEHAPATSRDWFTAIVAGLVIVIAVVMTWILTDKMQPTESVRTLQSLVDDAIKSLADRVEVSSGGDLVVRETRFDADAGLNRVVIDDTREGGAPLIGWSPRGHADVLILGRVLRLSENRDLTAEAAERYLHADNRLMALVDTPVVRDVSDASPAEHSSLGAPIADPVTAAEGARDSGAEPAVGALSEVLAWLDGTPGAGIHWPELAGDKKLYVGVDPDCIHCHRYLAWLADHTTEFEQAGVTPVIVPVGFLTQASPGKAAAMIAGGIDAVWRNESGFDPARGGGLDPVTQADAADAWAQMQANTTRLFRAAEAEGQSGGTPMLLWRAGNARDYLLVGDPGADGMALILASFAEDFTDTP